MFAGAVPGESPRLWGQDPGDGAGLVRAGSECGAEQVTSERVCAAPGLFQELPPDDVSGGELGTDVFYWNGFLRASGPGYYAGKSDFSEKDCD